MHEYVDICDEFHTLAHFKMQEYEYICPDWVQISQGQKDHDMYIVLEWYCLLCSCVIRWMDWKVWSGIYYRQTSDIKCT